MSINEFAMRLAYHDWTYQWSDDHRAWERGAMDRAELLREANGDSDKRALYLFKVAQHAEVV